VEISFSLSFTDGMDYAFKAKLNPDELTHQQQSLNQFFDRFPLAKNRFQLTAMEVSGSISVDGEGVQVVAKAYVHAKFGDKEVELNFDVNIQHDHDVIIKAIENKLQEMCVPGLETLSRTGGGVRLAHTHPTPSYSLAY
jgi:hypothetical protein